MSQLRLLLLILLLPLLVSCLHKPILHLGETAIRDRQVWSGEVLIDGVVVVKKEGALTILPGTTIRFVPRDDDGDGIGDSELLIEGEIIARGTAESPILLTSAAKEPAPGDWKYLYLDFARRGEIDYVISEYAYSGIQIHFCQATVYNSVFRYNIDGVRFSTVNLEVVGNHIHDNRHGLRYEERRSKAVIHHNVITDNDIGIFPVTRCDGGAVIEQNNITGSRRYAVKLGLEQHDDIPLQRNWWGNADPEVIGEQLFDHRFDPTLGRVDISNPLTTPVKIAHRPIF